MIRDSNFTLLGSVVDPGDNEEAISSRNFYYAYDASGNREGTSRVLDGEDDPRYLKAYAADRSNAYSGDAENEIAGIANAVMDVFSGEVEGSPSVWDNERNVDIPQEEMPKPGEGAVFEHPFDTTIEPDTRSGNGNERWFWFSNPYLEWVQFTYPAIKEYPQYDADGNLTGDGRFTYRYDLENRLIEVGNIADRMRFSYDYLGRRVEQRYEKNDGGTWTELWARRFLYDGFQLIAEIDPATDAVQNTYYWGYDISHSLGGAGGIGGLLMVDDGESRYLPGYDGQGNLTMLLNESDGSLAARFEYGPYGEILRKEGATDKIPFRYQTKWDLGYGSEGLAY